MKEFSVWPSREFGQGAHMYVADESTIEKQAPPVDGIIPPGAKLVVVTATRPAGQSSTSSPFGPHPPCPTRPGGGLGFAGEPAGCCMNGVAVDWTGVRARTAVAMCSCQRDIEGLRASVASGSEAEMQRCAYQAERRGRGWRLLCCRK